MPSWEALLTQLAEVPRENGTASLHRSAAFLRDALESAGAEAVLEPFVAAPYALRLAGVLALAGGLLYWRLLRAGRWRAALAAALVVPGLILAQLELQLPVFGWLGAETQHHVLGRLPARSPEQRLAFAAHYDTKTDVLDHVQRAPVDWLAAPMVPLMVLGALAVGFASRGRRAARRLRAFGGFAAWSGLLYGGLAFVAFSAGAFVPQRSPGALDDGGSCAVLVQLARRLGEAAPLERTDVELWLFSAEEVGVQGSWSYARKHFASRPQLPTFVVNLEGLGASAEHAVLPSERSTLRSFPPDPRLVALLDRAHRERFGAPLGRLPVGGATDARSFLAHGIPAVTVVSLERDHEVMRGLHSSRDERGRLDEKALEDSVDYLLGVVRRADAAGFELAPRGETPHPR